MAYETERAQLDADFEASKKAAQDALSAVVNEFARRKRALMAKHGVKNMAVAFIEQGRKVSHTSYPDGSGWYNVDDESYGFDDDESAVVASAIVEAIDLDLIVVDYDASGVYVEVYRLPVEAQQPGGG
jgi:hypothetical protein